MIINRVPCHSNVPVWMISCTGRISHTLLSLDPQGPPSDTHKPVPCSGGTSPPSWDAGHNLSFLILCPLHSPHPQPDHVELPRELVKKHDLDLGTRLVQKLVKAQAHRQRVKLEGPVAASICGLQGSGVAQDNLAR